jgi:hypothetical protein
MPSKDRNLLFPVASIAILKKIGIKDRKDRKDRN